MIPDPYQRLLHEIGTLRRKAANATRVGPVTHVQGDKIRMQWGIRPDGSPALSPWISTSDHRGTNTEQHVYKVGQNVRMSSPNGNYGMATVTHWAPNESAPAPDHAEEGAHTAQIGELRETNKDDTYEKHLSNGDKGKIRMNKEDGNGITCRFGKDMRVHVNKDEVLMKAGTNTIFVDKKGCWSTSPLKVKPPKSKDDNK